MIMTENQICKYMKHILIPEIGRQGQEKILDSSVILHIEAADKASLMLYYLASAGVGQIYCSMDDTSGWKELSDSFACMNSDAKIQLQTHEALRTSAIQASTRIIAGSAGFAARIIEDIVKHENPVKSIPTVVCIYNIWKGIVRTFTGHEELKEFLEAASQYRSLHITGNSCSSGSISAFFSSLTAVIEHIKTVLTVGKPLLKALYYDLSIMEFDFVDKTSDSHYRLMYSTQPEENFNMLKASSVLITGCGGEGYSAAYSLASSGVGRIGLASSLNRRIILPKLQSSEVFFEAYNTIACEENLPDFLSSYDIIIAGIDDPSFGNMLRNACAKAGKPLLEAGMLDISGAVTSIIPGGESRFSRKMPAFSREKGVLEPAAGILGIIQAAEAVKLLTGIGKSLENRLLLYDIFDTDIYVSEGSKPAVVSISKNKTSA